MTAVGVILANLGSPDAPTPRALRRYLRQFLGDRRVVELPRALWWPILNCIVLPIRSRRSAALYRSIWTDEGSPLTVICRRQARALQERLRRRSAASIHVVSGMTYGSPSIADALQRLREKRCGRIVFLPTYPQYSGTTTASALDTLFAELGRWRRIPELRTVGAYHDDPGYISALSSSILDLWSADGEPDRLLLSFHGIPQRYVDSGDPYYGQCLETAGRLIDELGIDPHRAVCTFQSRFGRGRWIEPATDTTIREMAASGVANLDVICPGFAADCLETLEEIDGEGRALFVNAGGRRFRYIPCLNERDDHIELLASLAARAAGEWFAETAISDT